MIEIEFMMGNEQGIPFPPYVETAGLTALHRPSGKYL